MSMWASITALENQTPEDQFEAAVADTVRSELEKSAGELSEYLGQLSECESRAPSLDRFRQKTELAHTLGRELAVKEAGIGSGIINAVKPLAGRALGYAAVHPQQATTAGLAAAGGLAGAATSRPGHRLSGALGGAALGGAAGYGLQRFPTNLGQKITSRVGDLAASGWKAMGEPKLAEAGTKIALALPGTAGRMGLLSAMGGVAGALHKSNAEKQGLAPGHHIRNALIGAAGGAVTGKALGKTAPAVVGKVEQLAAKPGAGMGHSPYLPHASPSPSGWGHFYSPADLQQMERVKAVANSSQADRARKMRALDAAHQHMKANPHLYESTPGATSAGKKITPVSPTGPTMAKVAHYGGREFLKRAFSMSAQAEPGTPSGAQDPETDSQFSARPASKPAVELYGALKHLSPKTMRGLQAAQSGM